MALYGRKRCCRGIPGWVKGDKAAPGLLRDVAKNDMKGGMNAQQICNYPVAFSIGGHTIRFRQLSCLRFEAHRQAVFLSYLYEELSEKVANLPGLLTAEERHNAVAKLHAEIPDGIDFDIALSKWQETATIDFMPLWKEACADEYTLAELSEMFASVTAAEIDPAILHVFKSPRARRMSRRNHRNICRSLAKEYGYTPEQIGQLSDDQIFHMVPGLAEDAERAAIKAKYKGVGSLVPQPPQDTSNG